MSAKNTFGDRSYSVYMHLTPSGKRYIGITGRNPKKRWRNGSGYHVNKHFTSAIHKYGWLNIAHIIISQGLSKNEALHIEQGLIALYQTTDPRFGYNKSSGGEQTTLGKQWSDEEKERLSNSIKQLWQTEYRERVIATMKQRSIKPPSRKGCVSEKRKPVFQYTMQGHFIAKYPSIHHAADAMGVDVMAISNACNGRSKSSCGYIFRFEDKKHEESNDK